MTYELNRHRDTIENLLAEEVHLSETGDHSRALAAMESAKFHMQEMYYDLWLRHHKSEEAAK